MSPKSITLIRKLIVSSVLLVSVCFAQEIPIQVSPCSDLKFASNSLIRNAKQGDLNSQREIGLACFDEDNKYQASIWLWKAAKNGDIVSQRLLGIMYLVGDVVPPPGENAETWLRPAAYDGDDSVSQRILGAMYLEGKSLPPKGESVTYLLEKAANNKGDSLSARLLGQKYFEERKYKEAENYFRQAYLKKDVYSTVFLGMMYLEGKGVDQNSEVAVKLFRFGAVEGNDLDAQRILGMMLLTGKATPEKNESASQWLEKSAEQGDGLSKILLGIMYMTGEGVNQPDKQTAAIWLDQAIAKNFALMNNIFKKDYWETKSLKNLTKSILKSRAEDKM